VTLVPDTVTMRLVKMAQLLYLVSLVL